MLASGCMTSPTHTTEVVATSSSILFDGYTHTPSQEVTVQPWFSNSPDGFETNDGYWLPIDDPHWPNIGLQATTGNAPVFRWFDTDLYMWSVTGRLHPLAWEPGSTGYQAHVRATIGGGDDIGEVLMTFDPHTNVYGCLQASSGWSDFSTRCRSEVSPVVQLQTSDYVPFFVGDTTCTYGSPNCDPCVDDVVAALTSTLANTSGPPTQNLHINGSTSSSIKNHLQGHARLTDITGQPGEPPQGRIVVSRNAPPELFVFNQNVSMTNQVPTLQGTSGNMTQRIDIISKETFPGRPVLFTQPPTIYAEVDVDLFSTHPGGLASVGDIVAVPMEGYVGEVVFYRAGDPDPFHLTEVSRFRLGEQAEPDQGRVVKSVFVPLGSDSNGNEQYYYFESLRKYEAGSMALTRLRSGRYLMLVTGRHNGRDGGWFYVSNQRSISEHTTWSFVDKWEPPCVQNPDGYSLCWQGADNVDMINQCDGSIFVLGMAAVPDLGDPPRTT